MKVLFPFLKLYKHYILRIFLGLLLTITTLAASIFLLTLSGWFLASTAIVGVAGIYSFNYMLPAAGVRGAAILRTASRYGERLITHDTTFRILATLRLNAFSRLLTLSAGQLMKYRRAELLNRFVADINTLDHLYLRLLSPFASAFIIIFLVGASLAYFDLTIAKMLFIVSLVILFLIPAIFYLSGKKNGTQLASLTAIYREQLVTLLKGHAELQVFGALPRHQQQLAHTEQQWLNCQNRQLTLAAFSRSLLTVIAGLTALLVISFAIDNAANYSSSATIALFLFATLATFEALAVVPAAFIHLSEVITAATRVNHVLQQAPSITFPVTPIDTVVDKGASLHVNDVSFSYPLQPQQALNSINFSLSPGEHVALLGKTGCGKSTLLSLIIRFWDCDNGTILLNNRALTEYDEASLRQLIAFIPQRVYIFSATLRYNLQLANANATDEQLVTILQQTGLDYLLKEDGLALWLGENGRSLSGGELKRMGIARALLHDSPLIIMDEPTEGLDDETAQQMVTLITEHCRHKTLLLVTHRPFYLEHCQRLFVMENGQIIKQGTYANVVGQKNQHKYVSVNKW